jgi:hypothetical protein
MPKDPGSKNSAATEAGQHGPISFKQWPNAVTKAPQPLPGQGTKKSPAK